jgi:hypothetical protein
MSQFAQEYEEMQRNSKSLPELLNAVRSRMNQAKGNLPKDFGQVNTTRSVVWNEYVYWRCQYDKLHDECIQMTRW